MSDPFAQLATALAPTYVIERELGGGGMSRVFVAAETRLGRKVVIKVLPPEASAGIPADRFEREIRLAASLQHPSLVPVLNAGSAAGLVYYVMPYINGESLAARIAREGALPVAESARILQQVADALAYAHAQGIVHRDVKPDNILLSGRHALVTDFGVAKAVSAAAEGAQRTTLTEAGFTLGTPAYMAPEQATADPLVDHRADIYALGAVGYEMLAGRPPFSAPTAQGMIAAHVAVTPEPVDRYRPGIPPELSTAVMRCLAKHPADRWQTAEALIAALDTTDTGPIPVAGPKPAAPVGRVLGIFALATVGVTGAAFALSRLAALPDWIWIGALGLMAAGLPILLYTGRLERRRAVARATGSYRSGAEQLHHRAFTWRRALIGGALALGTLALVAGGWAASRELGIGPAATLLSAGQLDSRDRLVLADFVNGTNDSTLATAITEALRVDLGQSRVVRLLDARQVAAALERMGASADTLLDEPLAREVAVREGAKAVVTGEVTTLGSGYVLTARIVTADSGATLVPVRVTADGAGGLIEAVNRLSSELRERIGESLRDIRGSDPLERVTTASLPALRAYTEGSRHFERGDYPIARDFLLRAVAIDSGFAMAWRKLGAVYFNTAAPYQLRLDAARRAFQHRDRLPPLERHLTDAYYYSNAEQQPERAIAAYHAVLEVVPDEFTALNNLSILYQREGRFAEAEAVLRRGIEARGPMTLFVNIAGALVAQSKWAAVDSFIRLADSVAPATHSAPLSMRRDVASARRDYASQDSLGQAALQNPRLRLVHWLVQWDRVATLTARGRFREAGDVADEIRRSQVESGDSARAASALLEPVVQQVYTGRTDSARSLFDRALRSPLMTAIADSLRPHEGFGFVSAVLGDPDGVSRARAAWERHTPAGSEPAWATELWDARLAEAEGRWRDAAEILGRSQQTRSCVPCGGLFAAQMWDRAGEADSALAWYRRGVESPMTGETFEDAYLYPIALRRLGALYEERAEPAEALDYYGRFVELWRDADPELQPIVTAVRERMARLAAEPRTGAP